MIGMALAFQSFVLVALHLGLARLASAVSRRLVPEGTRPGPSTRRIRVLVPVLLAAGLVLTWQAAPSGWVFLGIHLLAYGGLATWAGCETRLASARPRRATAVLHAILAVEVLAFLQWRGILVRGESSPAFAWVLNDVFGQLVLPVLDRVPGFAPPGPFPEVFGLLVTRVLANVQSFLAVAAALGAWAMARVTVDRVAPRIPPVSPAGDGRSSARIAVVLVVLALLARLVDARGGVGEAVLLAGAAGGALLLAEGGFVAASLLAGLRVRALALALTLALTVLVPALGAVLVSLGALEAALGGRDLRELARLRPAPAVRPVRPALLWIGTVLVSAALGLLGLLSDRDFLRTTPSASRTDPCEGIHASLSTNQESVVYSRAGGTAFSIDVEEFRVPPARAAARVRGIEEARALCASEGKRLCRPDEWYLACACGHRETRGSDLLWWRSRRNFQDENLLARARTDCGTGIRLTGSRTPTGLPTGRPCRSDDGVVDLLGGMTEILESPGGSMGILLAGPAHALIEDWMVKCEYRGSVTASSLAALRPSFVGVRCCDDPRPGGTADGGLPGRPEEPPPP